MKANEAPEKIYTDSNGNNPLPKRYLDSDVEYTRTDAFIDKACEWIQLWTGLDDNKVKQFRESMKE